MRGAGRGPTVALEQVREENIGNVGGLSKSIVEIALSLLFAFSSLLYADFMTFFLYNLFTIQLLQ